MACRLIQNVKHSNEYNAGGITNIYMMDIHDFGTYIFRDDSLYDQCYVSEILLSDRDGLIKPFSKFMEIGSVNESNFTENQDKGMFRQELNTFVRTLDARKLSDLLIAKANKYVVAFRTSQDRFYAFGSDGGASLSFSQITGQLGEVSGYSVTITKNSMYPLFELSKNIFRDVIELITNESGTFVTAEDDCLIEI